MTEANFVHLRVRTSFSLSEGACHVDRLARTVAGMGSPAVAATDTGTMAGAMAFTEACASEGVQPIVGASIGLTHEPSSHDDPGTSRIALLAADATGWSNLVALVSRANRNTADGRRPHVSPAELTARSEGLILLTGGPEGPVDAALRHGDRPRAERRLRRLRDAFGDRVYAEIQRAGETSDHEDDLLAIADALGVPPVATNDAFFIDRADHHSHDILLCISEGTYVEKAQRRRVSPERHVKTPAEMAELFADLPDAVENTVEIAKRCSTAFRSSDPILPPYPDLAEDETEADALRRQAVEGLERRLAENGVGAGERGEHDARLAHELDVIENMGFPGYFLIVADFIQWAKENGIAVGPGRGSGAGSLVAYALRITDLDPLRYGLLFERFLNPDRVSMPDFDIDFCQANRDDIIDYVRRRYGEDRVLQIGTFGSFKARAAFRSAARALQVPFPVLDAWSKLIPSDPSDPKTLSESMNAEPLRTELSRADQQIRDAFNAALGIEGLHSNASTHAAGVVIADRPVDEIVPIMRDREGNLATNFDMKATEKAGLVKFDFLGLKTLDVIEDARSMAAEGGRDIDFDRIGVDDPDTYAMLREADTFGVFQLESEGMRQTMRRTRPESIHDIVALVSLYRPGPMENIPEYAAIKNGEKTPSHLHPDMEPILRETHGIIVYQEQVMEIAQRIAGYSLGQADILRRAMGKKIQSEMDKQHGVFVEGAVANGVDRKTAEAIFDLIARFASYGFNKSHAACYAVIAYQTAYLKRHTPHEFFAASMNLDISDAEKLSVHVRECRREGLAVDPPDVNASLARFSVRRDDAGNATAIRYALSAVRGVGTAAMNELVAERRRGGRFETLDDLVRRTIHAANRKAYEGLVKSGACDGLPGTRAAMLEALPRAIKSAQQGREETRTGQASMLDMMVAEPAPGGSVPDTPEADPKKLLSDEREVLGFYLSGHPLDEASETLRRAGCTSIGEVLSPHRRPGGDVRVGALISKIQIKQTRKREAMAITTLSDPTGETEAIAFPDDYARLRDTLREGRGFVLTLGVGEKEGFRQLSIRDAGPLPGAANRPHDSAAA